MTATAMSRSWPVAVGTSQVLVQRVLSAEEAARATHQVLNPPERLRLTCWHQGSDLTTIGAPFYRYRDDPAGYHRAARRTNHGLLEAYGWLHDRLAGALEEHYGVPVVYADELAVPGFHLFRFSTAEVTQAGGWHHDQLVSQLPQLRRRSQRITATVNLTLPLAVPTGGTGMDLQDVTPAGLGNRGRVHVPYTPGVLLLNPHDLRHRIAASRPRRPGEVRLTLQGHGAILDGRLVLFW